MRVALIDADVAVLGELAGLDARADADGRHVDERLLLGGERDPDQLGGAERVRTEQLAVGQHVVDQCGGVDDQVDGVGQPLPGLRIQPEVGLALVAGDDLEMVGGQFAVVAQQFGVAAVERLVQPFAGGGVVLGAHQADHLAVDHVHPLQPFQGQVAAEESGRAGQQHRAHLRTRTRQRRGRGKGLGVDELVQRQVAGVHLGRVAAVHRRERRPLGAGLALGLDVGGQGCQVAGRADDDADGHVDVEDLVQQVGECQRGQRISTEVGEVGVGLQVGGRRAQQRSGGPADGLQHRPVGAVLAQFPQLVGLAVGQVGVELFEPIAVVLLELRPCELADAGQQTVLERERRCLDDEVARNLVGLQARRLRHVLQRLA